MREIVTRYRKIIFIITKEIEIRKEGEFKENNIIKERNRTKTKNKKNHEEIQTEGERKLDLYFRLN